ncbi:hypothetical protein LTR95_012030, partial [Oleoguttula sp. CCFEE 5521]
MDYFGELSGHYRSEDDIDDLRPLKRTKLFGNNDDDEFFALLTGDSMAGSTQANRYPPHGMTGVSHHHEDMLPGSKDLTKMEPAFQVRDSKVIECYFCGTPLVTIHDNYEDDRCAACDEDLQLRHAIDGVVEGGEAAAEEDGDRDEASENGGAGGKDPDDAVVVVSDNDDEAPEEVDTTLQFWPDVERAKYFLTLDDPNETFRIFIVNDDLNLFTDAYFEAAVQKMYGLFTHCDATQPISSKVTQVAKYHQSQRSECKYIRKILVADHQKQRASARATAVIGKIKRLHFKGIPLSREKHGWDPARYGIDEDLSATARLAAVLEAMECLFVARDIITASDRSLEDLVLNPIRYRDKKLDNFKSNESK